MRLSEWLRIDCQLGIVLYLIFLPLAAGSVYSQAPTLNPDQTVNTATGEMGFSLPLGTVKGINGKDFPITVNYKAGIPLEQEASPVGLGFSYGAGYITRRVVHIPDDNTGGDSCFFMTKNDNLKCDTPWWYVFYKILLFITGVALTILSIYCPAAGFGAGLVFSVASSIASAVIFAPSDYRAGGTHLKAYEPIELLDDSSSYGKGFFNEGYHHRDLPDIYFVNTPFMQGELAWCGSYNNSDGGYFVFRNTQGSSDKEMRTIKVDYSISDETFLITLSDGTRLFFEETKCGNSYSKSYCQIWGDEMENVDCKVDNESIQFQRVPEQWFLTKVLFPDYVGDIDPLSDPENAKGTWIVFEYDRRMIDNCRPLPKTFQANWFTSVMSTPGYHPTDTNTSMYEEVVLERIITPDQKAQYFYTPNRLDNLWFDIDCMDWFAPARNQTPAEKRVKRKPGSDTPYIQGKVLDSIIIYSNKDDVLRRIKFNTGYSLKPGNFRSYTKDTSGNFDTVPGNPDAACLTLESVEVLDLNSIEKYRISFKYINKEGLTAWDSSQIASFRGPDPMPYYIERKDYWGYFLLNDTYHNNFNRLGIERRDPFSAAMWSMKEIDFSTGLKIGWEYDLNRYDAANNLPVSGLGGSKVKYGGGIRVHTMTIDDGIGESIKRSYFYTDQVGDFYENINNSSGHVTVEPYPYLISEPLYDVRNDSARGGHYTACKVMYEMVQVVDNFHYGADCPAPNGYTVYEYITPADHSPTDTFMNEGQYGEIDNSWKRGFLKKKSSYNSANKLLASKEYCYEFVEQNKIPVNNVFLFLDPNDNYLYEHRFGWVKLKSVKTYSSGVKKIIEHKYAEELNRVAQPDYQYFSRNELKVFDAGKGLPNWRGNMNADHQVYSCRSKKLKGTDQTDSSYDYIVVRSNSTKNVCIFIGKNIKPEMTTGTWTSNEYDTLYDDGIDKSLVGIALHKMPDGDDYEDLIIVSSPLKSLNPYLYITVLHNIGIDSVSNKVNWDRDLTTNTKIILDENDLAYLDTLDDIDVSGLRVNFNHPRGCVISNFNQDIENKPDILLLTNVDDTSFFRGDMYKVVRMDSTYGRNIFAFIDFVEPRSGTDSVINGDMKIWRRGADKPYHFYGNTGFFKAIDNDGIANDLVIVGPGATPNYKTMGDISEFKKSTRHVSYQVFKDINLNENGFVKFDETFENFRVSDKSILFNVSSNDKYDSRWNNTKHAAYFEEDDKKTFIFFQKRVLPTTRHFYLLDYLPVYYEGDYDGTPNRTIQKNSSNQPIMLTNSIPAYFHYDDMANYSDSGDYHTLNNECGSIQYHFPPGTADSVFTGDLSIYSDRVVSSKATTWDKINGVFVPQANYIWNVTMNSSGLPDTNYAPFDYTNGASNPYWLLTDSITEYTEHSQLKESVKPLNSSYNVYSAVNYGHNDKLPVASLKNAKFKESGVLTCDYNNNDENFYIDKNNGWELGDVCPGDSLPPTVELDKSIKHFGNASMHVVNAFGPSRNFKLTKYSDYIMSAWVNVISDTVYMTGDFRYIEKTNDTIWPVHPSALNTVMGVSFNGIKQGPTGGKWVLLKLKIPADSLLGSKNFEDNNWYARMFVGPYKGGEVYIDEIRFYPEKAMVTSSYYDSLWHQPILSIDENNKPGLRISYDGFGRPILWEKINPQFSVGETGFAVTVKEKNYFTKYDGICIISPKEGDYYAVSNPLEIKWRNDNERDVEIFYSIATDSPWVSLGIVNAVSDKKEYSYIWNVPVSQEQSERYRIKIVDIAEPNVYDQTMIFSIAKGKVFYPEKGSRLLAGMREEIRYYIMGDASVDVAISVNGLPIDTVKNTGIYLWSIPGNIQPNNNHIISIEGNGITAESEKFTIINNQFIRKYQCDFMRPQWK